MDGLGILTVAALFGGYAFTDAPAVHTAEIGIDRFEPLHADRQLTLTNVHLFLAEKPGPWPGLSWRLGAVGLRATGSITQLTGSWEAGTLRSEVLDSPGWGLGPSVEARQRLLSSFTWRLSADASAAVLLHDRRFPAGGDRYNGMFQIGPSLTWLPSARHELTLGARWLHLSNGQGITPRNPSYEGRGLTLRYRIPL